MTVNNKSIIPYIIFIFLPIVMVYGQTKAFPGAEGFGAFAAGGRGGTIIEVTNLNNSGAGSLRAACEVNGPRIVIFNIGGTIQLSEDIYINNPYLTIAGQTAPGDGILIRGAAIRPSSHDIIIRGLRFRIGDDPSGPEYNNRDGLSIENPNTEPYNIIIDHCSFSWATDENIVTWYASRDITIQWCIISQALQAADGEASYGALLGYSVDRISILHNLFAHNRGRNPLAQGGPSRFEIINNLIYNWGVQPIAFESERDGPCNANVIGNQTIPGPDTDYGWISKGIWLKTSGGEALHNDSRFYVEDNLGPGRTSSSQDDWDAVQGPESFRSLSPIMELSECSIFPTADIYSLILSNAGAIVPYLDPIDQQIVKDVESRKGSILRANTSILQWPNIRSGENAPDGDHDGIPDEWENERGLNPMNAGDALLDRNGDGFTNIEEYINGLISFVNSVQRPRNLKLIQAK